MIQGTLEYSSPSVAAVAAAGSLHKGMEKRDTSDFTWENWKYGHYLHRAASCVLDPRQFSLNGSICSLAICRFSCDQGVWERQKKKDKRSPHESRILTNRVRETLHSATSKNESAEPPCAHVYARVHWLNFTAKHSRTVIRCRFGTYL